MAYTDYATLRVQSASTLADINEHVEALLAYPETLPDELRIRLDTFHADIAAAIEDVQPAPACPDDVTPITA